MGTQPALLLATTLVLAVRWAVLGLRFRAEARRTPVLAPRPWAGAEAPLVTIVVPARDEEATIATCLASLSAQDYPSFEVVVVDDRSTDRTAAIVGALPGVTLVAGLALPPDWTGKSWANWQGALRARGEWLLFTDADTWHHPNALSTAMAVAPPDGLLSLSPLLVCNTFWEKVIQPAMAFLMAELYPLSWREDPARPQALANGQFMLMTRATYDAIGGHRTVAGTVLDDVALAHLIKAHGRPVCYPVGKLLLHVRMYDSLGALWRGWRKAFVGPSAGPLWKPYTISCLQWTAESVLPWVLAWPVLPLLLWARWTKVRSYTDLAPGWHLLHPLGVLMVVGIMLDALWRSARGKRDTWRGRLL